MNVPSRSLTRAIAQFTIALGLVIATVGAGAGTATADDQLDSITLVPDYTISVANRDGDCGDSPTASTLTVTPEDADGTTVNPGTGVVFSLPAGSPLVFLTDPDVQTPGPDGSYAVQITSPIPGVFEVIGALADGTHETSVRIPFRNGPLDQDQSSVTVTEGTRVADNDDPHMVTLTLMSQCGLPIDLSMAASSPLALSVVDAVSGVPVTVSYPPVDPSQSGLLLIGYFQTSPGVYNALLVSNRPGLYNITLSYNGPSGEDQTWIVDPSPLTVQFVSAGPDPTGTLTVADVVNGTTAATANVVDEQGGPAQGVDVSFQINGNARFDNGQTTMTVPTDTAGRAVVPITVNLDPCDTTEFTVSASLSTTGVPVPLNGSPVQMIAQPPAGACHVILGVDLVPTTSGIVYANGQDSWTGTVTATMSNGKSAADIDDLNDLVRTYRVVGTASELTDAVTVSAWTNTGNGLYTLRCTTTQPGTYVVVPFGNAAGDPSNEMTFQALPTPPTITQANATRIVGTASQAAMVRITDAAGGIIGTDIASDGSWSIDTPAGVPSQQITVSVMSDGGIALAQVTAWLDTDRPDPPRVDRANETEVAGDLGAAEPSALVTVEFPDGSLGTTTAGYNGAYSIAVPEGMDEGAITVYQTDTAGNQSDPTAANLVVTPPIPPDPPTPPTPPVPTPDPPAHCWLVTLLILYWKWILLNWF